MHAIGSCTRRRFLRSAALGAGALLLPRPLLAYASRAPTGAAVRVGFVGGLPSDARSASALAGVELGVEEANRTAALFGSSVRLERSDSAGSAVDAARALVAAGATVLVSALDDAGTAALVAGTVGLGVPVLNVTAPADRLRGPGCAGHLFHVAPSRAMLADAVALWLVATYPAKAVALVATDAESVAVADRVEARIARRTGGVVRVPLVVARRSYLPGLHIPEGAVVLIGAGAMGFAFGWPRTDVPLVDLSGVDPAPPGAGAPGAGKGVVLRPVAWHPSLDRFGADQLNRRYRLKAGRAMDGAAWAGWAAVKIATEAAMRAASAAGGTLAEQLTARRSAFDAQKGWPLSFRPWDRQLRQPIYIAATDAARVAGEVPGGRGDGGDSAAALDALGDGPGDGRCAGDAS